MARSTATSAVLPGLSKSVKPAIKISPSGAAHQSIIAAPADQDVLARATDNLVIPRHPTRMLLPAPPLIRSVDRRCCRRYRRSS